MLKTDAKSAKLFNLYVHLAYSSHMSVVFHVFQWANKIIIKKFFKVACSEHLDSSSRKFLILVKFILISPYCLSVVMVFI